MIYIYIYIWTSQEYFILTILCFKCHRAVLDGGLGFDWMAKRSAIVSGDAGYWYWGCEVKVGVNFNLRILTAFCQWYQLHSNLKYCLTAIPRGGGGWFLRNTSYCVKPLVLVQLLCEICLVDNLSNYLCCAVPLYPETILYPRIRISCVPLWLLSTAIFKSA